MSPATDALYAPGLIAQAATDAFTASLIADCGQPNFPGGKWWLALFLAVSALIAWQTAAGHAPDLLRPRATRSGPARIGRAPAGRLREAA